MSRENATLTQKIEAVLFAAGRPFSPVQLARQLSVTQEEVAHALEDIAKHLNAASSGINLFVSATEVALCTNPDVAEDVRAVLKRDITGELTKPSVETLAIIAYRGPLSKAEIEQIRGVNCSLILRNLQVRGLVNSQDGTSGERYSVSMEYLQHLGVTSVNELPNYRELHTDPLLASLVDATRTS